MSDELAQVLDRRPSGQPLWSQVLHDLRRRLGEGEFVDTFPGEHALSAQYDVSRHTIREALRVLRDDGTVTASRGRPSLLRVEERKPLGAMCSFSAALEVAGLHHRTVVCSVGFRVDHRVALMLEREKSERLLHIKRLQLVGEVSVAVDQVWLAKGLAEPLLDADLTEPVLDAQYARLCGLVVTGGEERILPVTPTSSERSMLDIDKGVAAFAVERLGLADGRPVEWRRTLVRSDWFGITAELSAKDGYRLDVGVSPERSRIHDTDGESNPSS